MASRPSALSVHFDPLPKLLGIAFWEQIWYKLNAEIIWEVAPKSV
jgi:hypothetical protein